MSNVTFHVKDENIDTVLLNLNGIMFRKKSETKGYWDVRVIPKFIEMVLKSNIAPLLEEKE